MDDIIGVQMLEMERPHCTMWLNIVTCFSPLATVFLEKDANGWCCEWCEYMYFYLACRQLLQLSCSVVMWTVIVTQVCTHCIQVRLWECYHCICLRLIKCCGPFFQPYFHTTAQLLVSITYQHQLIILWSVAFLVQCSNSFTIIRKYFRAHNSPLFGKKFHPGK